MFCAVDQPCFFSGNSINIFTPNAGTYRSAWLAPHSLSSYLLFDVMACENAYLGLYYGDEVNSQPDMELLYGTEGNSKVRLTQGEDRVVLGEADLDGKSPELNLPETEIFDLKYIDSLFCKSVNKLKLIHVMHDITDVLSCNQFTEFWATFMHRVRTGNNLPYGDSILDVIQDHMPPVRFVSILTETESGGQWQFPNEKSKFKLLFYTECTCTWNVSPITHYGFNHNSHNIMCT